VAVMPRLVLVWIGASWGMELLDIERSGPIQPVFP
jgi:hypothetical protein